MATPPKGAVTEPVEEVGADTTDPVHDRNRELRTRFLALEAAAKEADAAGDSEALAECEAELRSIAEAFVETNSGLVAVLVNKYRPLRRGPIETQDLMLAGLETLWASFLTWDPDQSTFATWSRKHVEGAIRRERVFHERSDRRYHAHVTAQQIVALGGRLAQELGRQPTIDEIADAAGMTVERLTELFRGATTSLDAPVGDDGNTTVGDLAAVDRRTPDATLGELDDVDETRLWFSALNRAIEPLTPRQRWVALNRLVALGPYDTPTLNRLASQLGLGRELVRRDEVAAKDALAASGVRLPERL